MPVVHNSLLLEFVVLSFVYRNSNSPAFIAQNQFFTQSYIVSGYLCKKNAACICSSSLAVLNKTKSYHTFSAPIKIYRNLSISISLPIYACIICTRNDELQYLEHRQILHLQPFLHSHRHLQVPQQQRTKRRTIRKKKNII